VSTLTIGEVLNELKDEFEDITISKIRFLESEGLIAPDRTESGYRKFSHDDVERLRYVLRTQRDRYLPLKVIKQELDRLDAGQPVQSPPPPPPPNGSATRIQAEPPSSIVDDEPAEAELGMTELCEASGLDSRAVRALQDHGLLAEEGRFDGDDLRIARAASALIEHGLEPRHLRMYRQFADREIALCEQLISPLLKQRNPDSRRSAIDRADELVSAGGELHRLLLGREVRAMLGS
jgi:DNA-binding transcriptional MerR regulator